MVKIVQMDKTDKYNYTGEYGEGYVIINKLTGEMVAGVPTLGQAEDTLAQLEAKAQANGTYQKGLLVIEQAGYNDFDRFMKSKFGK